MSKHMIKKTPTTNNIDYILNRTQGKLRNWDSAALPDDFIQWMQLDLIPLIALIALDAAAARAVQTSRQRQFIVQGEESKP